MSPFKVKGHDDNNVGNLNKKDQYELEKELERETLRKISFTGIYHLMKQRRQKAQAQG